MPPALKLRIDPASPLPAYRQIVDGLRVLLVEGALRPGSELPSVRRLALELGIHFNTVGEAYRQLAAEGWLDLRHGRTARVLERAAHAGGSARGGEFRSRLRSLVAEMRAAGLKPQRIADELESARRQLE